MYEQFFGLRERPFDLTPSPRFLVLTDSHREALRNLEYGIGSRKGITLLIGEAGSGKTTIIRSAIDKLTMRVHCVHINNPTLSRAEFVEMLAGKFELSERASQSKTAMLNELETLLRQRRDQGETTVLIVDEAQSLPLDLLEEIRLLANIETDNEKLLSVIIAGQPELAARLNNTDLRQLKQRVALRCELRSLKRLETESYVAGRIKAAGGVPSHVFTREAVSLIHEASNGLPRTINVIADNALLGGFASGVRPVGTDAVIEVCRDFDLLKGRLEQVATSAALAGPGPKLVPHIAPGSPTRGLAAAVPDTPQADTPADPEMYGTLAGRRKRFSFFWS
jgi:general secretion pathway protein A